MLLQFGILTTAMPSIIIMHGQSSCLPCSNFINADPHQNLLDKSVSLISGTRLRPFELVRLAFLR